MLNSHPQLKKEKNLKTVQRKKKENNSCKCQLNDNLMKIRLDDVAEVIALGNDCRKVGW